MHGWPDEVLTRGLHFTWLSDVKHLYFQSLLPSNHNIVGFEHLFSLRLPLPNTHKIIHTASTSEEEENPAQEIGDAAELKPKSHLSSPPGVYQERSTEHSNRIHLKSYSSLSHKETQAAAKHPDVAGCALFFPGSSSSQQFLQEQQLCGLFAACGIVPSNLIF